MGIKQNSESADAANPITLAGEHRQKEKRPRCPNRTGGPWL